MLLADTTLLEFIQNNWGAITVAIGTAATAIAGCAAYCIRAIWVHAAYPFIVWCGEQLKEFKNNHYAFMTSNKETQEKQAVILARMDEKLGAKLNSHGEAIEHTANGIIAHVEGKPDEAKQFANKAKEVVR